MDENIMKDLGMVTAYAYAVSKGYTGTEEEFAELMASYADVGQIAVDAALRAKASEEAAKASETASAASETAASTSASSASTSATNAAQDAQRAENAKNAAAAQASTAANQAISATQSANTASAKATEASQSASSASESATAAQTAKTAAETAQEAAETAETNAKASETAAASSATSASNSATTATTKASEAAQSATDAGTSATNAANSATAASGSASTASTKASEAAQSATNAASSATAAGTAKTDAEAAKTAAQTAQTAAETAQGKAEDAQDAAEAAAQTLVIDPTLTQPNQAAEAKATGDAISLVKSQIGANAEIYDEDVGSKIELVEPNNWFDSANVSSGILHKDGTTETSTSRFYTDYIPANYSDVFRAYYVNSMMLLSIVSVCCYDYEKNVLPYSGTDTIGTSFSVPYGVAYIRMTLGNYYTSNPWITKNFAPSSSSGYAAYFAPYKRIVEDFITPSTEDKINAIPSDIANVTVKGTNLIPISTDGVGAYVVQSGVVKHFPSYTTYHYAIIPIKPNTLYSVNYRPAWWILTDDNDTVLSSGTTFTPASKLYFESGNATKMYYTVPVSYWNVGLIVAEGVTGTNYNIQSSGVLNGITQLHRDTWYALAIPKTTIRLTNGLSEKFYFLNMLSLPDVDTLDMSVSLMSTVENDGVLINPNASGLFNNYLYAVYDDNMMLIESNVNGQFGECRADNVQNCTALLLGDSTIDQDVVGQKLLDAFTAREKTITLLGTLGTGSNKNEGRAGWSTSDYLTDKQYDGVTNPFYNPTSHTFDFSYYMTNQGYTSVDYVVIQLGINDLYNVAMVNAKARIDKLIEDMSAIISSIKAFNANQKIILNLPTPCTSNTNLIPVSKQKQLRAKFIYYNALMQVLHTGFSDVRCSNCHLILNPATDIGDTIHPTADGYNKMALEILSQINCWQNQT